jgi:hypothetical protein
VNEYLDIARLEAVIANATGLSAEIGGDGVMVKFLPDQVVAIQRAALLIDGVDIRLRMWPAELAPQYKFVYSAPNKVEALIALADEPGWEVKANFHLAYWLAAPDKRWYPRRHLSGPTYVRQWIDDFHDHRAGRRPAEEIKDPGFRHWLVERCYASESELATLDQWADDLPRDHFDIRPSIEISRSWQIVDAVERDRTGKFVQEVREGINQVLAALGERQLDVGFLRPE